MALKPASWRGVPFAVRTAQLQTGRRLTVHEYTHKDVPWIEDTGRKTRRLDLTGFLVTDSAVYGGGNVQEQAERLTAAAELKGEGVLVHPDYGPLNVACSSCTIASSLDGLNVREVRFTFYEAGERVFPSATEDTASVLAAAATAADAKNADAFAASHDAAVKGDGALASGKAVVGNAFVGKITRLARDATAALRNCALLAGNYGRFFNGRRIGFLAATPLAPLFRSLDNLISATAELRAQVDLAASEVVAGLNVLGISLSPSDFAGKVTSHVGALANAAIDPQDRLRILADLCDHVLPYDLTSTATGRTFERVYRVAAVVALARAVGAYQPASYDDAANIRRLILARLDHNIVAVADDGLTDLFRVLRGLKAAVVRHLAATGADLAPTRLIEIPAPIPAIVLAHRLYGDPDRADELILQADPVHPLFMPTRFRALAS